MWFEILPAAGMIFTCMTLGMWASGAQCRLLLGKWYMRDLRNNTTYQDYLRDERISGDPYKIVGLEALPDESETHSSKYK